MLPVADEIDIAEVEFPVGTLVRHIGYNAAESAALGHAYAVLYAIRARGKGRLVDLDCLLEWHKDLTGVDDGTRGEEFFTGKKPSKRKYPYIRKVGAKFYREEFELTV